MAAGSRSASSRAGATTSSASAMADRSAAEPVRSTPAFLDLISCDAMSATTLGRASKLAPITPTGRRRSCATRPPGSSLITRLDGSAGTSASSSSWSAMPLSRVSSSRSRSFSAPVRPAWSAARMSSSLAARIASDARPSRSAIARSARPIASSGALARLPAARWAASAAARTAAEASCRAASSPVVVMSPIIPASAAQLARSAGGLALAHHTLASHSSPMCPTFACRQCAIDDTRVYTMCHSYVAGRRRPSGLGRRGSAARGRGVRRGAWAGAGRGRGAWQGVGGECELGDTLGWKYRRGSMD